MKTNTVLFKSRNKDNRDLEEFKERTKAFLTDRTEEDLMEKFERFVDRGVKGEISRFYISVNARDTGKTRKALLHYFIDNEDVPLYKYESVVVSVASKPENRAEEKWLFDYDDDLENIDDFLKDVKEEAGEDVIEVVQKTRSGYAVVVKRGFDTRKLLEKWDNVGLKRDGELFVTMKVKD